MARRDGRGVRLFTRNGYNFSDRFPKIVEAVSNLSVRFCLIDGEAIVVDERGLSVFDEELTQVRLGKIIKDKYPELNEDDQEAVRQHAVAARYLHSPHDQLVRTLS
jgi:ATP-dependent DNA ligase